MIRTCILALLLALSLPAFAGTIRGDIQDAKDSSGVATATVAIPALNRVVNTDISGHYELINLPDGTYQITIAQTGYKTEKRSVTLTGGGDATLDAMITSTNNQLKVATVRSFRQTRTETAVLLEVKKANTVVSAISAAQISKSADRNAADVVKRIPGVTIQDDRFITIRGLADRYNTVWLNDAGAPSAEVDKKSFSFDLIPSGLIDRILIFKTPSAELPGDFAGGMVKIYTTSIPDKTTYTLNLQTSYRNGSTGTGFNYQKAMSGDAIGYDNGSRNIPAGVPAAFNGATPDERIAFTKLFDNDWTYKTKNAPVDLRASAYASNLFKFNSFKIGNTLGISYANTYTNYEFQRYDYDNETKIFHYNDKQSTNKVNTAILENLAFVKGNSKIEFKNLYNQIGNRVVIERNSVIDTDLTNRPDERAYLLGYDSKRTYTAQLLGSHHNERDTRKYTWALGYTSLDHNQPDLKRLNYARAAGSGQPYTAQVPSGTPNALTGGGRYYADLKEKVYSFSHQITQRIGRDSGFNFELSAGNYIEYKKRSFAARELGYLLTKSASTFPLFSLPIDSIFADQNVGGTDKFNLGENTSAYDKYAASTRLIATFLSANIPVTDRLRVVAGVRYENNLVKLDAAKNLNTVTTDFKTDYFLPSVNASYNFTSKALVRAAYGMTLNRPEFREFAPIYYYDFDLRAGTTGALFPSTYASDGDTLKVCTVQNFDVRYEWYPSAGEVLHVGVFYKSFANPIQHIRVPGAAENGSYSFANGVSAYVAGAELEVRKNLAFLDERLGAGVFHNFTLTGNVAVSKSELKLDSARIKNLIPKGPLEGQSPYVVNAGIYYQADSSGFSGSLLYNVYGPRLYAVGTATGSGSVGELPFHSLDVLLAKSFIKGRYSLSLGVQNLLDQSFHFVEDTNADNKFDTKSDKTFTEWRPGRYFTLGVKVRL